MQYKEVLILFEDDLLYVLYMLYNQGHPKSIFFWKSATIVIAKTNNSTDTFMVVMFSVFCKYEGTIIYGNTVYIKTKHFFLVQFFPVSWPD